MPDRILPAPLRSVEVQWTTDATPLAKLGKHVGDLMDRSLGDLPDPNPVYTAHDLTVMNTYPAGTGSLAEHKIVGGNQFWGKYETHAADRVGPIMRNRVHGLEAAIEGLRDVTPTSTEPLHYGLRTVDELPAGVTRVLVQEESGASRSFVYHASETLPAAIRDVVSAAARVASRI